MIAIIEETCSFDVKRDRVRKPVLAAVVEDVATPLQKQIGNDSRISSARGIDRKLDMPNRMTQSLTEHPYKMTHVQ